MLRGCRETQRKRREKCAHTLHAHCTLHTLTSPLLPLPPQDGAGEVPHPLDVNYKLLKAKLQHLDKSQEQYAVIEKYLRVTEPHWRKLKILDVWEVDREGEVSVSVIGGLHCGAIQDTFCLSSRANGLVSTVVRAIGSCFGMEQM